VTITTTDPASGPRPLETWHRSELDRIMRSVPFAKNYSDQIVRVIREAGLDDFRGCTVEEVETYVNQNYRRFVRERSDDPMPLDLFLWDSDTEPDWHIEGLFEWGSRVMVTGEVGAGKSTLLQQIAVRLASGLHPFHDDSISDSTVLLVDAENPRSELQRRLRDLTDRAGDRFQREQLLVECTDGNPLHLDDDETFDWLRSAISRSGADVLILGPLYKLTSGDGDPKDENVARRLTDRLDALRTDGSGISIILEAHTTKGNRDRRPANSGVWDRWPDYGFHLAQNGHLTAWRPPRGQGDWPTQLQRGGLWPWLETTSARTGAGPESPIEGRLDDDLLRYFEERPNVEIARSALPGKVRDAGLRTRDLDLYAALDRLIGAGRIALRTAGKSRYYSTLPTLPDPSHDREGS